MVTLQGKNQRARYADTYNLKVESWPELPEAASLRISASFCALFVGALHMKFWHTNAVAGVSGCTEAGSGQN